MARWVIYGKMNFWFQDVFLPKGVLDSVWKIIYTFIWEGRKGIEWRQMTKAKGDGRIGLKDTRPMVVVASIKRIVRIWMANQSIWVEWMREGKICKRAHTLGN